MSKDVFIISTISPHLATLPLHPHILTGYHHPVHPVRVLRYLADRVVPGRLLVTTCTVIPLAGRIAAVFLLRWVYQGFQYVLLLPAAGHPSRGPNGVGGAAIFVPACFTILLAVQWGAFSPSASSAAWPSCPTTCRRGSRPFRGSALWIAAFGSCLLLLHKSWRFLSLAYLVRTHGSVVVVEFLMNRSLLTSYKA